MPIGSPALFDYLGDPPAPRHRVRAFLRRLARMLRHFSFFVVMSFVAHLALFGMVFLLGPRPEARSIPPDVRFKDLEAFKGALQKLAAEDPMPERLAKALISLSEEEIRQAFLQAPLLDYRLTDREKAGWYKMMLAEALAGLREGAGEGPPVLDPPLSRYFDVLRETPAGVPGQDYTLIRIDGPLEDSARLYKLSKKRSDAIESLTLPAGEAKDLSAGVGLPNEEGRPLSVPAEYFYRDSPYAQIVAAGAGLFYVIKGFPELPSAGPQDGRDGVSPRSDPAGRRPKATPESALPVFTVVLMPSGGTHDQPAAGPSAAKPALALGERQEAEVLDALMELPVAEQVRQFYKDYLEVYDSDSPDLARLTRGFIYRNLGMVFVQTGSLLSRGFDLLEEVFYDNFSQHALVAHALRHPKSRTGVEIFFGLAASYEFERRALVALDESLDSAEIVLANPPDDRFPVHNKKVKAYALREVYRDLAAGLRNRDYPDLETVLRRYRDEQIGIYDFLKGLGGTVACRAQYAFGRLHWDEGRTDLALAIWMDTDPAFADATLMSIRDAIAAKRLSDPIRKIDYLFSYQAADERYDLLQRIEKFHKWARR